MDLKTFSRQTVWESTYITLIYILNFKFLKSVTHIWDNIADRKNLPRIDFPRMAIYVRSNP